MALPRRFLIASAASLTALVALAGPAFAHANASAKAEQAGRTAITVSIEHGCNGNPVTGVRVALPSGATAVTGTNSGAWTSTVSATEISWTGGSMPANSSADFDFSLVLAQPAGETVTLPTIQTCTNNTEIAWIQAAGGEKSEATQPAPKIVCPPTARRLLRQRLQSPLQVVRQPLLSLGWRRNQTLSPMRGVRPTLPVATSFSVSVPSL